MALSRLPLAVALVVASTAPAYAEVRGVLRIGVAPVDLAPEEDTPLFGGHIDDAVGAYNAAAVAYNQLHGYEAGSPMASDPIAADDLGVRATMLTVAPGLEAGHRNIYVRIEGTLGFADELRAYGLGFYPLNLAVSLRRGAIVPYLSAGGTASWLDRTSTDGELGALLTARVAAGMRVGHRMTLEIGYGAFLLGGLIDRGRIRTMEDYDPSGGTPPPAPTDAVAGGEQRGMIDASFGFTF